MGFAGRDLLHVARKPLRDARFRYALPPCPALASPLSIKSDPAGWNDPRQRLGADGEDEAKRYLVTRGFTILAHRWRMGRLEIDLIARNSEFVVFVEVKTRQSDAAGLPVEAVDGRKQRKLTQTALAYLKRRGMLEARCRFDVISIIWPKGSKTPEITHYKNAFPAVGVGQMYS